jgi:hypothetical protein
MSLNLKGLRADGDATQGYERQMKANITDAWIKNKLHPPETGSKYYIQNSRED